MTPCLRRAAAATAAALSTSLACASGGAPAPVGPAADPDYARAVEAVRRDDYDTGIRLLEAWIAKARTPSADAENWLGYAYRKSGRLEQAFAHYDRALSIDPRHRGAHEYVGEAYLMVDNLPKAEEHLKILDHLCLLPCEEFTDLKEAIEKYKVAHPQGAKAPAGG